MKLYKVGAGAAEKWHGSATLTVSKYSHLEVDEHHVVQAVCAGKKGTAAQGASYLAAGLKHNMVTELSSCGCICE